MSFHRSGNLKIRHLIVTNPVSFATFQHYHFCTGKEICPRRDEKEAFLLEFASLQAAWQIGNSVFPICGRKEILQSRISDCL